MKKNDEKIVGIKPKEIVLSSEKKTKKISRGGEPHWPSLVSTWFAVYAEQIPEVEGSPARPCFDSTEARQMKNIIRELRLRAQHKDVEWTEEEANKRFRLFLLRAWEDDFISKNFMLRIISNNKTKILNNQITPKYGINKRNSGESPHVSVKHKGGFGKL